MRLRGTAITIAALAVTLAAGCSSSSREATRTVQVDDAEPPSGPVFLAAFATGVGGVRAGVPDPVWLEPAAVAAADGTSVFSVRHSPDDVDQLVRIDPETGDVMESWPLPTKNLTVAAVAPKARWIALTDRKPGYGAQTRPTTTILVFDTGTATMLRPVKLTGDVQPEAFSIDGTLVFALNYVGDHYRVQNIELATGRRFDTSDRDKVPPEDMHGQAVHGVMSHDRTLLATLYRNPGDADEPAFVHVLDLQHGWSYCADLPAPFGTGSEPDVIELTPADTVVVAATDAGRLAEIHVQDVREPPVTTTGARNPVRVTYRAGHIESPDAPFRSIAGFEYLFTPNPA